MPQTLSTIRRRSANNTLEVEHILKAAISELEGLPELLNELSIKEDWSYENTLPDGSHVVPFARWAKVASAYCQNGLDGLGTVLESPGNEKFVLALLEEHHSVEALGAILRFFGKWIDAPSTNAQLAHEIARSLNHILCFKPIVQTEEFTRKRLCAFAISLSSIANEDVRKAIPLGLLRAVGDESTIEHLDAFPPLGYPWEGTIPIVKRAIRKRLNSVLVNGA